MRNEALPPGIEGRSVVGMRTFLLGVFSTLSAWIPRARGIDRSDDPHRASGPLKRKRGVSLEDVLGSARMGHWYRGRLVACSLLCREQGCRVDRPVSSCGTWMWHSKKFGMSVGYCRPMRGSTWRPRWQQASRRSTVHLLQTEVVLAFSTE